LVKKIGFYKKLFTDQFYLFLKHKRIFLF